MSDRQAPSHQPEQVNMSDLPDSGARTEYETGARRDAQQDKGRFDLLPWDLLTRLAVHYERGGRKYGPHNWRQGIPLSSYFNSAMRHLVKMQAGLTDEDHAAAAVFNIFGYAWTLAEIEAGRLPASLDDRWKRGDES